MNWRNNACKARGSWSMCICWQMLLKYPAHQKKRIRLRVHALRGNVSAWQTALPILPSVSQEEISSSMKLRREVRHRFSRASAVIWHIVTAHPQMRNCCFGCAFSITRDHDCSVVWWKGCCVQKEHTTSWGKSGFLPASWGEGPYNQLLVPAPVLYSSLLLFLLLYVVG